MDLDDLLSLKVSFQPNIWTSISKELTIQEVLSDIQSNKYQESILALRALLASNSGDIYAIHKKTLPSVTFSATFYRKRRRELLKEYNSLLVIDIDNIKEDNLAQVKSFLENDEYVFAYWLSPSGSGFKGLLHITYKLSITRDTIDKCHQIAFQSISSYFSSNYQIKLDQSGSDITRLCFLSYDPHLRIKDNILTFDILEQIVSNEKKIKEGKPVEKVILKTEKDIFFNSYNKNSSIDRKKIQSIIKYLKKRKLSITATYEEWYRVAYALANTFTYELGEKYFLLLSQLDQLKYNEINCQNMLRYCYRNNTGRIRFRTIEHFAQKKGYILKSQGSEVPKTAPNEGIPPY